jgi:hypothetical protein
MVLKEKLFTISVLLSLVLGLNCFVAGAAQATGVTGPDEAVVASLLQKTYTTTKLFAGGNKNWDCSYKIVDTVAASSAPTSITNRMKFLLTPLSLCKYYTRCFEYSVQTSRGKFSGEQWFKAGDLIRIEANTPIPAARESLTVHICEWSNEEVFYLFNVIPLNAISPEQAFRKTFEVYYATHGLYPTAKFSFEIEFYDQTYWLVTFDDNDGIGGQSYLLIDALTGEAGEIKEDE